MSQRCVLVSPTADIGRPVGPASAIFLPRILPYRAPSAVSI